MNYQNRFVIFIDILGFKDKIKATTDKEGLDNQIAIKSVSDALEMYFTLFDTQEDEKYYKTRQVTQFSDSIVISFQLKEPGHLFSAFINSRLLILELVYKGFLCRGGMTYGKMIHTKKLLFGPAVIEAYELESKGANYPRIIVSEGKIVSVMKEFLNDGKTSGYGLLQDMKELEGILKKDFDGLYYLDYFFDVQSDIDDGNFQEYYNRLRSIIVAGLSSKDESIKVKFSWMSEKYNIFVKRATSRRSLKLLKDNKDFELLAFCKSLNFI
jgi:hypothetical protein